MARKILDREAKKAIGAAMKTAWDTAQTIKRLPPEERRKEHELIKAWRIIKSFLDPKDIFFINPEEVSKFVPHDFNVLAPESEHLPLNVSYRQLKKIILEKAENYYNQRSDLLEILAEAFVEHMRIEMMEKPRPYERARPWAETHNSFVTLLKSLAVQQIREGLEDFNEVYRTRPNLIISLDCSDQELIPKIHELALTWYDTDNKALYSLENQLRLVAEGKG